MVRGGAALAAAVLLAVVLVGCTARDDPTLRAPSASTRPAAPPVERSSSPTASRSRALQELALFDAVNRRTAERGTEPGGRAFIDALVAAGFHRADMQVTEDRTTIGSPVPSVQFSVLWQGVCLVGQHGPGSGGYRSVVVEPVDGRCLIGRTRPIDW